MGENNILSKMVRRVRNDWRNYRTRAAAKASFEHVCGPRRLKVGDADVVLAMLGRDSAFFLDEFYEHHKKLGIAHFVYLDNDSSDNSVSIASSFPNTTVLRSRLNFREHESIMRSLMCTEVVEGGWRLCLDDDERFDYPNSANLKLPDLVTRMTSVGYTGMIAQMLDMVPAGPISAYTHLDMHGVREAYDRCYLGHIRRMPYHEVEFGLSYFSLLNKIESRDQSILFGGLRGAIFGEVCALTKHPLFRMAEGVMPMNHPHFSGGLFCAPVDAVLYHYKFAGGIAQRELARIQQQRLSPNVTSDAATRTNKFVQNPDLELSVPGMEVRPTFQRLYESGYLFSSDRGRALFEHDARHLGE